MRHKTLNVLLVRLSETERSMQGLGLHLLRIAIAYLLKALEVKSDQYW